MLKILPAIFLVASAIVLLTMHAGASGSAAEECRARPGLTTPRGEHWYYRVSRADKRHCWFLGSAQARAHVRAAARATGASTAHRKSANAGKAAGASAQAANAQAANAQAAVQQAAPPAAMTAPVVFLEATLAAQKATDFAARWPHDLPSARDLNEAEPQTLSDSYAERRTSEDRSEPMPSWPLVTAVRAQGPSAGDAALRLFSLAGGAAIALLLFIGWAAKFTRSAYRSRIRDRWRAIAIRLHRRANFAAAVHGRPLAPTRRDGFAGPPPPTDPAVDLKTSLAELMRDLRRTETALESGDVFGRAGARKQRRAFRQALRAAQ